MNAPCCDKNSHYQNAPSVLMLLMPPDFALLFPTLTERRRFSSAPTVNPLDLSGATAQFRLASILQTNCHCVTEFLQLGANAQKCIRQRLSSSRRNIETSSQVMNDKTAMSMKRVDSQLFVPWTAEPE